MSFGSLVNGADCGPINPLNQLSKLYNNDRGVQQVSSPSLVYIEIQ